MEGNKQTEVNEEYFFSTRSSVPVLLGILFWSFHNYCRCPVLIQSCIKYECYIEMTLTKPYTFLEYLLQKSYTSRNTFYRGYWDMIVLAAQVCWLNGI